ncbi:MAG: decarboxylating 6-phosphogluconate dehydrogenase [Woeseiaceae bacterium]|nr:decarboxylating 6-phosphogluconate dehydrogenase [Woeseiaceae bacterium]
MQLGIIGLGKMGGNMARRLRRAGIDVVGFDQGADALASLAAECGLVAAESPQALVQKLDAPRLVWLMLPAGDITESAVRDLGKLLQPGDVLIDGANSFYKDSMRHAEMLAESGVLFVDAGVSGGVWGLDNGYTIMAGGSYEAFARAQPIIEALAPATDRGWIHTGPAGSGHFVKMIHNGIEYGMMQAYAEGFALLKGRDDFDLDLAAIAETWRHGSVVRSWLLDLTADVLAGDQTLEDVEPFVADSGEGRWTALEGIEQGIPTPVMSLALMARFATQGQQDYSAKLLAMMRNQFGGHAVRSAGD